ncbi:MAG: N-acetyl-gamma-glutamyl-phosphate reductase [Planctomycetia bacterium]|nr:N-acetyl-gamma-glutamyl-phosphate reductase [Planctomycetia bacterium]
MIRVAILGATGYSALELVRILLKHPEAQITALTSRQEGNPHIAMVHPSLVGRIDLRCENLEPSAVAARADCVFCCLPHGVVTSWVPPLLAADVRVIDLSADYRLKDPEVYTKWYALKHGDTKNLPRAVYGLPELYRSQIREARLVANPGCYPTCAALALGPLLKAGLIEPRGIIIDSKSGVSGAGRELKLTTHYPECNESVSAYNVGTHRHTPEIEQTLAAFCGQEVEIIFTPHLIPMDRGILTTAYSTPRGSVSEDQLKETLQKFYADEPFVRVVDHLPGTKDTCGTNFCHVTARLVRGKVITISCEDNLVKGASGQAVQNMNLMFGFPETMGL